MTESKPEKSRRLARKWKEEGRCNRCGGKREDLQYLRCRKCRKLLSQGRVRLVASRDELGLCRICGKEKPEEGFKICVTCAHREYKYQSEHPEKRRASYQRTKREVMDAYGGCCACCGEREPAFLCIDHVNNDGESHRRALNNNGGTAMYTWLKAHGFPPGFRVLCHNCNIGRHINGGVCPHEAKKAACGHANDRDVHAALNLERYPRLVGNDNACGDRSAGLPIGTGETVIVEAGTTESALLDTF